MSSREKLFLRSFCPFYIRRRCFTQESPRQSPQALFGTFVVLSSIVVLPLLAFSLVIQSLSRDETWRQARRMAKNSGNIFAIFRHKINIKSPDRSIFSIPYMLLKLYEMFRRWQAMLLQQHWESRKNLHSKSEIFSVLVYFSFMFFATCQDGGGW